MNELNLLKKKIHSSQNSPVKASLQIHDNPSGAHIPFPLHNSSPHPGKKNIGFLSMKLLLLNFTQHT